MFKIVILTIFTSYILFGHVAKCDSHVGAVHTGASNNFTLDQFLDKWYVIAVTESVDVTPVNGMCDNFDITEDGIDDGTFVTAYYKYSNKNKRVRLNAGGQVIHSAVRVDFPNLPSGTRTSNVYSYNNGTELILVDMGNKSHCGLISRYRTASTGTKAQLEIFAQRAGSRVYFIDQTGCQL